MQSHQLYTVGAYAAALCLTLTLAAYLTPRRWWRRPNARALLILAGGTWGLGSLALALLPAPAPTSIASGAATSIAPMASMTPWVQPATQSAPIAGQPYRVHQDLNLRAAAGVAAARIVVVPAGASVTPTGLRSGDWWQVSASVAGRASTGWASSLWLRRAGEAPPQR